ncbi:MAG: TGS domain-containing protein, partial [Pseudomonadota bacterium]
LRQVLEWHEELGGTTSLRALLRHKVSQERIYVSTPKGHVLDLPDGATVLDFAYRVHTEIGHACESGSVDGKPAGLNQILQNSEQVSVEAGTRNGPLRAWAEIELGYATTDRARAKLVSYFRSLSDQHKMRIGRALLAQLADALLLQQQQSDQDRLLADCTVATQLPDSATALLRLGSGELLLFELAQALRTSEPAYFDNFERAVSYTVTASNRDGLLLDITQLLNRLDIALLATTGRVSNGQDQAIITFDISLRDWYQALLVSCHLHLLNGLLEVRKQRRQSVSEGEQEV